MFTCKQNSGLFTLGLGIFLHNDTTTQSENIGTAPPEVSTFSVKINGELLKGIMSTSK